MKYGLSNEEAIQAIKSNYPPESYTMLREALDMAMNALQQLTEKDATIKELKEDKRKLHAIHDEQCARSSEYYNEIARLRKALEEIARIESHINITTIRMQEIAKSALGEGDKE